MAGPVLAALEKPGPLFAVFFPAKPGPLLSRGKGLPLDKENCRMCTCDKGAAPDFILFAALIHATINNLLTIH